VKLFAMSLALLCTTVSAQQAPSMMGPAVSGKPLDAAPAPVVFRFPYHLSFVSQPILLPAQSPYFTFKINLPKKPVKPPAVAPRANVVAAPTPTLATPTPTLVAPVKAPAVAPGTNVVAVAVQTPTVGTPATPLPVTSLPVPAVASMTTEIKTPTRLPRLPGLPDDLSGNINVIEENGEVYISYALTNLGKVTYTLAPTDLRIMQENVGVRARLDRRNGNLTPGVLLPDKGEIGTVTLRRVTNAPVTLIWTIRQGESAYTLKYTVEHPLVTQKDK